MGVGPERLANATPDFAGAILMPGGVKDASLLPQQRLEDGRNGLCTCSTGESALLVELPGKTYTITETEGLQELYSYLDKASSSHELTDPLRSQAVVIRDKLAFLGRKEYVEATRGIAQSWMDYLGEDNRRQLAVVVEGSYSVALKSGNFVLDAVLTAIGPRLSEYRGRLLHGVQHFDRNTDEDLGRIVLLDDLVVSGQQMRCLYNYVRSQGLGSQAEIQVIAASKDRVERGLDIYDETPNIPLSAYYRVPNDVDEADERGRKEASWGRISSWYSSSDHSLTTPVWGMAQTLGTPLPPLAGVVRPYHAKGYEPRYIATQGGDFVENRGLRRLVRRLIADI